MYRVNEIFYSLQGEGRFTGTPAVFLRFSGCNLRCSFCDTRHEDYSSMSVRDILNALNAFPARTVVITGGEPTLQLDAELCGALQEQGWRIHLETNGTRPLQPGVKVDWVTCSPKEGGDVKIQGINELKVLFWGQDVSGFLQTPASEYRLQPLDTGDAVRNKEILKETIDYILMHPTWQLSLQTHKILNVR